VSRPRIVIVGAGFAGYRTARTLARLTRHKAGITLLNPTDYFLYLPLLPQVAAGILEPRRITVPRSDTLHQVRLVLGEPDGIDLDGRTAHYTDPEGGIGELSYDRMVIAVGSVNKLLPLVRPWSVPLDTASPEPARVTQDLAPVKRPDRPATPAEGDS
jgi:NADH dehydrogenase